MQIKTKAILFLITIPIVAVTSTLATLYFDFEHNLPDPLNVLAVLFFTFAPLSVMLWYWITRFYFKREENDAKDREANMRKFIEYKD